MRNRSVAAAGTVAVALLLVVAPSAAAAPDRDVAHLTPTPDRVAESVPASATGSCPAVALVRGTPLYPTSTTVFVDEVPLTDVKLAQGEFTAPVALTDLAPGEHKITTACGGTATLTVLAAPTLRLDQDSVAAGGQVVATGTCPPRLGGEADLFLDRERVTTLEIDPVTGEFRPTPVPVPVGAAVGDHAVRTSCDGSAPLAVLPQQRVATTTPSTPTRTQAPTRTSTSTVAPTGTVTVPDLKGLSESEATTRLGNDLHLGGVSGSGDRIVGQNPPAGTQVQPGTAVAIVLAASSGPPVDRGSGGFPVLALVLVLVVVLVAAVLAGTGVALRQARLRRTRRERRWVDERTGVSAEVTATAASAPPPGPVAGVRVDIDVSRDPETPRLREVSSAQR